MHGRFARSSALAALCALSLAGVALAAPGQVRTFGPAGEGAGRLGPRASGIAVAADGTIFAADRAQDRVELFRSDGSSAGDWGGQIDQPAALALTAGGGILVGDEHAVREYATDGTFRRTLGYVHHVGGIAIAADGTAWATDSEHGRIVVLGGEEPRVVGDDSLHHPAGIAFAGDRVVVADPGDEVVKVLSRDGDLIASWPADDPRGVAATADGDVWVAEKGAGRIVRFGADGTRKQEITGLHNPRGVALDCRGAVYVLDDGDPRGHVLAEPGTSLPPCTTAPGADQLPTRGQPAEPRAAAEVAGRVEVAPAQAGVSVRATLLEGVVYIGTGAERHALTGAESLPLGILVDATAGQVRLELATIRADRSKYGAVMSADVSEGRFTVHQAKRDSLGELILADQTGRAGRAGSAFAAAAPRNRLWVNARGRFRTTGRYGAATVRGTRWLIEERAEGTYFRVSDGSVVVDDFSAGLRPPLGPGDSYLARPACASRRIFTIRLRPPAGTTVRSVSVSTRGKAVRVRRGRRLTARIDLRGAPRGTVIVRIRLRSGDGRTTVATRTYRTCRAGQAAGERTKR
jgi:DNA-binding beta-propeller fold protein YncE